MISQNTIDQVNDLSIVDVLGSYITLEKSGKDYKACCPFHNEKTASFSIVAAKNYYHCFGCGKGGNAINFVMEHKMVTYPEAIKIIAKDHQIIIDEKETTPEEKAEALKKEQIYLINSNAAKWFEEQLFSEENALALEYVLNRWELETVERFKIGFAPDSWDAFKQWSIANGFKEEYLIEAGLLTESKDKVFDYFRNRIMFPITDKNGRIAGFTGRKFDHYQKEKIITRAPRKVEAETGNTIISEQKDIKLITFPTQEKLLEEWEESLYQAPKLISDPKNPKYKNSPETCVFKKENLLYGLDKALKQIRETGHATLVEGNADVIRLHQIKVNDAVATCGTALTENHIKLLKSLCKSITIIGDTDNAGIKAVNRSGKMIIEAGLFCNVINLPVGNQIADYYMKAFPTVYTEDKDLPKGKLDPDSFFTDKKVYDSFKFMKMTDFIYYFAHSIGDNNKSAEGQSNLIDAVSKMLISLPENCHSIYIDKLAKIVKPKKLWQDALKELKKSEEKSVYCAKPIPANVSLNDFDRYHFYVDDNCYFFRTKDGVMEGSNFIMEPLFHIASTINAKRLYRITNVYGYEQVIELAQRDLISLSAFKLRIESIGNFLFDGQEVHLNKLKHYLYEKTQTCKEITQLGWQKKGFWAWSNGIYDGSNFVKLDENGIVNFQDENFYIPATSNIFSAEDTLYVSERKFKFKEGKLELQEYSKKMIEVYGENAVIGICYYIATIFSDFLVKIFKWFPVLNLFGPKGAGKSEMAVSLLQFFGPQDKGINIANTTRPGLADHVAMFSNALVHIDEYKNNLEFEKIEFLKGLWDRKGRTRMNMEKDRKKETTSVDVGVVLSGQEMPTADIALFTRLIFCSFTKCEYTDAEKIMFKELKDMEEKGISHITHDILEHREYFMEHFLENFKAASKELTNLNKDTVIEDRIFNNWTLIIAAYRTLKDKVHIAMKYEEILKVSAELILRQNQETKKSNEISLFWQIVEYLFRDNQIREDEDFKIEFVDSISTDKISGAKWDKPRNVLLLNHTRVFQLYRLHGQKAKENILPLKTIIYYLEHDSKIYMGKKLSVSFKTRPIDFTEDDKCRRCVTTAMAFDYDVLKDKLHINLDNGVIVSKSIDTLKSDKKKEPEIKFVEPAQEPATAMAGTKDDDLPF